MKNLLVIISILFCMSAFAGGEGGVDGGGGGKPTTDGRFVVDFGRSTLKFEKLGERIFVGNAEIDEKDFFKLIKLKAKGIELSSDTEDLSKYGINHAREYELEEFNSSWIDQLNE